MRIFFRFVAVLLILFLFPLSSFGSNPETITGPDYTVPCVLTLLGVGVVWLVMTAPGKDEMQITSEPSGVKIEIDGDYKGMTPLAVKISRKRWGRYYNTLTIKAYPVESGQYTQVKIIDGYTDTPKNVFFDMRLEPTPIKQEIKITQ